LSVVSVVCCQVEVSATSWSLSRGVLPTVLRRCVWSRTSRMGAPYIYDISRLRVKSQRIQRSFGLELQSFLQLHFLVALCIFNIYVRQSAACQSKFPRSLRCGSAAAHLMTFWIRIPPGHGRLCLVSIVCCQVEVSASGWSLVQRSPTECSVSKCESEALIMRGLCPTWGCCAIEKKN